MAAPFYIPTSSVQAFPFSQHLHQHLLFSIAAVVFLIAILISENCAFQGKAFLRVMPELNSKGCIRLEQEKQVGGDCRQNDKCVCGRQDYFAFRELVKAVEQTWNIKGKLEVTGTSGKDRADSTWNLTCCGD